MKIKFMYVLLAALLIGSQVSLSAQNKGNKERKQRPTPEQVVKMQTDRMVKALMLDDATAAKFTPVYEKYLKELRECRMMNHKPRVKRDATQVTDATQPATPRPAMTDAEIAQQIKDQFAQTRKTLDVREKFYNDFSKILSQKQILKIYQMERSYADKFKKEFERRKDHKPGQGPWQHHGQRKNAPKQG